MPPAQDRANNQSRQLSVSLTGANSSLYHPTSLIMQSILHAFNILYSQHFVHSIEPIIKNISLSLVSKSKIDKVLSSLVDLSCTASSQSSGTSIFRHIHQIHSLVLSTNYSKPSWLIYSRFFALFGLANHSEADRTT